MANARSEYTDVEHQMYRDERKMLWDAEIQTAKTFDHWMIGVAGGALALSMTMVKELISPRTPVAPWLLMVSWVALVLSVACTLISMLVSQSSFEQFREDLDDAFRDKRPEPLTRAAELQAKRPRPVWIARLNRGGIGLCLLGLGGLCWFVCVNLSAKDTKEKTNGVASQPTQQQRHDYDTKQRPATESASFSPAAMSPTSRPATTTTVPAG